MTRDILIGIDAGTSVIKSIAFQLDGTEIGAFALPNVYARVDGVGAEQDMTRTWTDTAATLRGLAGVVPDLAARTAALAVTAQGDGTWLIDADGRPTAPALIWLDARASAIVARIRGTDRGSRLFRTTGTGLNACHQSAQLLWLKENRPELLERSATALHCKDWLYFKLTGVRASDPSEGIFTFGNVKTRALDPTVVAGLGLEAEARLIPPIVDGVRTPGALNEAAARETGLPAGVPVVLGYVDIVTTALGAGLFDGSVDAGCTVIGSTGIHMRYAASADHVRLPREETGYTIAFPMGDSYAQLQSNMASTLNIDWILDLARGVLKDHGVAVSREAMLSGVDARVLGAEPGTLLFHPYISEAGERGPFIDSAARAQLFGLSEGHGYNDLLRAVFEGLAFAARDCYEAMGAIPGEVRVTGGAGRSKALRTILGAALRADIRTSRREEAGAAGAAMIAAVALGLYPDMGRCTERWVTPLFNPCETPDPDLAIRYERLFPAYVKARQASAPVWKALRDSRDVATVGRTARAAPSATA